MSEFYFIFIWIAFLAYVSTKVDVLVPTNVLGEMKMRASLFWAVIAFLPIIHLTSMGTPMSDTWAYVSAFERSEASWSSISQAIVERPSGFGYKVFQDFWKIIIGNNVTLYRIILALFHTLPVILVFRKYSPEYIFTVFLFVASGSHIAWLMNGLRQFLAVSIIFAGTGFIVRKQYVPAIALVLIASTVHTSALVMLPVIFIVQGKAWNRKTMLYIVIAVIAMFVFSRRVDLMDDLLQDTEYAGAVSNWQEIGDDGVHPLRVLVNALPVVLAFLARKRIDKENDQVLNICVNMSVINLGIFLVAMVTSGVMIGRVPIYVTLYSFILLAYLAFEVDWGEYTLILRYGSVIGYLAYYYLQYRRFK